MKTLLRILLVLGGLLAGVVLAAMVFFASPTFYGLRPHAVNSDLPTRRVGELLALAENGPTTAILIYDAWYKDRDGQTGWFILPLDGAENLTFNLTGALDPGLSKVFGIAPRRCGGTGLPEKMIRVLEPERRGTGFLGRSTCKRAAMDLSKIIAAARPATQLNGLMNHSTLTAFDADPTKLRNHVDFWPSPYAHHRTVSLPVIWQKDQTIPRDPFYTLRQDANDLAKRYSQDGIVGVEIKVRDWFTRPFQDITPDQLPIRRNSETVLVSDIKARRIDFVILCTPDHQEACNEVDVSPIEQQVFELRDGAVLTRALQTAQPIPENLGALRDVLNESELTRSQTLAPTASERQFSITWYEVNG